MSLEKTFLFGCSRFLPNPTAETSEKIDLLDTANGPVKLSATREYGVS
jgi:hypothetical protein